MKCFFRYMEAVMRERPFDLEWIPFLEKYFHILRGKLVVSFFRQKILTRPVNAVLPPWLLLLYSARLAAEIVVDLPAKKIQNFAQLSN